MAKFTPYSYRGRNAILTPSPEMINGLEEVIRWAEIEAPQKLRFAMSELCFYMALTNQGEARKMSFGPYDPQGRNSSLAWQTPVRRISQRYYLGWKVRPKGLDAWELYNDSREAYFIEFGISRVGFGGARSVPAGRIRRPIRKLSLLRTLDVMAQTGAFHRVWADIFRHQGKGFGFTQVVQAPTGGHSIFSSWGTPNAGGGSYSGPMLGTSL